MEAVAIGASWQHILYSFSSQRRLEHVLLLPILQPSALALVSANENPESKLVGKAATRSEGAPSSSASGPPCSGLITYN